MIVETKYFNTPLTIDQRDTLNIFGQFLRNDRNTPTKGCRKKVAGRPYKVFSTIRKQNVLCKAFGAHLLTFERTSPAN